jgi:hypothetical protein
MLRETRNIMLLVHETRDIPSDTVTDADGVLNEDWFRCHTVHETRDNPTDTITANTE